MPHPQNSSDVDFHSLSDKIRFDLDTAVTKHVRQNGGVEDQDSSK
jgi:hypothetical protein